MKSVIEANILKNVTMLRKEKTEPWKKQIRLSPPVNKGSSFLKGIWYKDIRTSSGNWLHPSFSGCNERGIITEKVNHDKKMEIELKQYDKIVPGKYGEIGWRGTVNALQEQIFHKP